MKRLQKCQGRNNYTNKNVNHTLELISPATWNDLHHLLFIQAHSVRLFALWVHLALHLHNTDGPVLQRAWPQGHVHENESGLYTDATSHVMHIPLKGGWTASPINRSPFQTALCSPTPGSWQQLAARTGNSSPACQSVHYGEAGWSMGVESQAPAAVN